MIALLAVALGADLPDLDVRLEVLGACHAERNTSVGCLARVDADASGTFRAAHALTAGSSEPTLADTMACTVTSWDPVEVSCRLGFEGDWGGSAVVLRGASYEVYNQQIVLAGLTGAPAGEFVAQTEQQVARDPIQQSKLLLKLIGTTGESSGSVADVWSDEDRGFGDLDAALAAEQVDDVDSEPSEGAGTVGLASSVGKAPAQTVRPRVEGSGEVTTDGDAAAAQATIERYQGQLTYCYEGYLKTAPGHEGAYAATWFVEGGRVSSVEVRGPAPVLATCIERKLKRWRIAVDEAKLSWTWTMSLHEP